LHHGVLYYNVHLWKKTPNYLNILYIWYELFSTSYSKIHSNFKFHKKTKFFPTYQKHVGICLENKYKKFHPYIVVEWIEELQLKVWKSGCRPFLLGLRN